MVPFIIHLEDGILRIAEVNSDSTPAVTSVEARVHLIPSPRQCKCRILLEEVGRKVADEFWHKVESGLDVVAKHVGWHSCLSGLDSLIPLNVNVSALADQLERSLLKGKIKGTYVKPVVLVVLVEIKRSAELKSQKRAESHPAYNAGT